MQSYRQTKIVATLGPATESEDQLNALVDAGVDVFRFNFSHGTHADHARRLATVREIEQRQGRPLGVFADLQGPKLRLGTFASGSVVLAAGERFRLDLSAERGDGQRAPLPHPEIFAVLRPGVSLLLDDGKVRLEVVACGKDFADTRVVVGGPISDRKGVNLPDVVLTSSPLTAKDRDDLAFALDQGLSLVALSFVQRPEDILEAKALMRGRARLIAKLERPSAIQHLLQIVALTDAVMVARGDLGVEMPPEDVPSLQKRIIRACRAAGKPVIVATQMLESMMNAPTPTRAEASDVANAVYDGADAVMLSGETAVGRYPIEAVAMMNRIIRRTENDESYRDILDAGRELPQATDSDAITAAARSVAETVRAKVIATFTTSGSTSLRASRERPSVRILALTPDQTVAHNLTLAWGVRPVLVPPFSQFEDLCANAVACATADGYVTIGDRVVITAGLPLGVPGKTNALHIVHVGDGA